VALPTDLTVSTDLTVMAGVLEAILLLVEA
jgi:hypothetical protein